MSMSFDIGGRDVRDRRLRTAIKKMLLILNKVTTTDTANNSSVYFMASPFTFYTRFEISKLIYYISYIRSLMC